MATSAIAVNNNLTYEARTIINSLEGNIISIQEERDIDDMDDNGPTQFTWSLIITIFRNGNEETLEYERYVDYRNNFIDAAYNGPLERHDPYNDEMDFEENEEYLNNPVIIASI
jgi:hypothetical protein